MATLRLEGDKGQPQLVERGGDARQGEVLLLHVEEHVAAAARVGEVPQDGAGAGGMVLRQPRDVGPRRADARRRRRHAQAAHLGLRHRDAPARRLAVQTHQHDAAGAQQPQQAAPAGQRVLKVMQHARAHDGVELPLPAVQPEQVRVVQLDLDAHALGHLLRVRQAGAREVEPRDGRGTPGAGGAQQIATGAAAGHQKARALQEAGRVPAAVGEHSQVLVEVHGCSARESRRQRGYGFASYKLRTSAEVPTEMGVSVGMRRPRSRSSASTFSGSYIARTHSGADGQAALFFRS